MKIEGAIFFALNKIIVINIFMLIFTYLIVKLTYNL